MQIFRHIRYRRFWHFTQWHALFFAVILVFVVSTFRIAFPFFLLSIVGTFHTGRSTIAAASGLFIFVTGLLLPFVGWLLDRMGIRLVIIIGVGMLAITSVLLTFSANAYVFVVLYGICGGIGYSFSVGVPTQVFITYWFKEHRGLALAVISNVSFVGLMVLAPIFVGFSQTLGWQGFFLLLAVVIALVSLPAALFGIRTPQDNKAARENQPVSTQVKAAVNLSSLLKNKAALLITGGLFACGFDMGIIDTHLVPMMNDAGLTSAYIASTMSLFGVVAIIGAIASGLVSDRLNNRPLILIVLFALRALSLGILLLPSSPWRFTVFAILFAVSYAGFIPVSVAALSDYTDRSILGTILGMALLVHQLGGFLSAYLGGVDYDLTKAYQLYVSLAALLTFLAIWVLGFAARYHARGASTVHG